ncbi:MAG TPA: histidine kinase [Terriglobales bacterium]|nr:histidine kinase [Terriglobales bacterium]
MDQRLILLTQLIKLGVAAAIASALVRSRDFKRLLFLQDANLRQRISLIIFIAVPYLLGVWVRQSVKNFLAADEAFEAILLMGVLGGPTAGAVGAVLVSLPALVHGEYATLPFNLAVGLIAGVLRDAATDREEIWSFSPFIDLSIYRWIRKMLRHPQIDWQTSFFWVIVLLQMARVEVGRRAHGQIFYVDAAPWLPLIAMYATTVATVAIPLKIWNAARVQLKLEEHERLLLQARMEALQSQINPHFLFNTLNSISSLVRVEPDTARLLIVKLANILRRLLRQTEAFLTLREELEFVDDYLDIEVVRFGPEKLRVVKEIEPGSLNSMVPSMLLQPLVENSIKHGLSPRIEGGSITLRSRLTDDRLTIELEDDGVGMSTGDGWEESVWPSSGGTGIGMQNVIERLKVLYGDAASMTVRSRDGSGTVVSLELPRMDEAAVAELTPAALPAASGAARYVTRSSTLR